MSTITGSINLMKFVGAKKIIANGERGIFIPEEQNPTIVPGAKGAYANVRIVESKRTFNDHEYTHFLALSLPRKQREDLKAKGVSDEQINALTPILGNLETYVPKDSYEQVKVQDAEDDFPF